jgi:hypothetical protein
LLEGHLRSIAISGFVALAAGLGICAAALPAAATTAAPAATARQAAVIPVAPALTAKGDLNVARPAVRPDALAATTAADNQLFGVSCKHAGDCLAVGANTNGGGGFGSLLAYLWNGTAWKASPIHLPSGATGGTLTNVSCTSGGCMAVGFYRKSNRDFPLAEFWTGNNWVLPAQPVTVAGGSQHILENVSCITAQACAATGFYVPTSNSNNEVALAETWNGSAWKAFKPPTPATPFSNLDAVSCATTHFCLAAGTYFDSSNAGQPLLADVWDGGSWHQVAVAQPTPTRGWANIVLGVSCPSSTSCAAVGATGQVQSNGTLVISAFAEVLSGSAWTLTSVPMPAGQQSALFAPSCTSPTSCVAVGGVGPLHTDNDAHAAAAVWNGSAWKVKVLTPPAGQGSSLEGIDCVTATNCVAVGTVGKFNTFTGHGLTGFWNGTTWKLINTA